MNVDAYFDRIGYRATPGVDLDTLGEIHRLHPCAIAFENLSTLLGEPVPLDIDSLEDKLVRRGRGGYCFEQNLLLLHVLEALGFECTPLLARVHWNREGAPPGPRTHMALVTHLDDRAYLCDVGFGGVTQTAPLELVPDCEQDTPHGLYRLVERQHELELQIRLDNWRPVYRFDLQPQLPVDYEPSNHYVATYPGSIFRRLLMVARADLHGRSALSGNVFTRYERGVRIGQRAIESGRELRQLLEREFGIDTARLPSTLDALLQAIAAASL
jgi:N-hydroxyarylamine O-acetyltransferase